MFSFTKSLTIAAGVAGAFAFGASNVNADTTDGSQNTSADYVVKSGDTLNKISKEFNVAVAQIAANNNISNIDVIVVGQHLTFAEKTQVSAQVQQPATTVVSQVQQTTTTATTEVQQLAAEPVATTTNVSSSAALDSLIARESSGNVNATNGQYYGIGQLSPQARAMYGGNSTDYNDQLNAMKSYISARYGTAENAWAHSQATGWY
ncbi:LysM peptidoglycan-binding domain-containing protein [uncultured Leuconostoc sp.]|uniref:LysM peptidoglycan-binding domain-containing protein n=1 Tax=uncultured Leuconostoc sp. TaxID=173262 RepID=UPI0025CBAD2C|nr:LysM peptidoglycan-binding domain-containing protein [uncultured Leuconostoc sp.]